MLVLLVCVVPLQSAVMASCKPLLGHWELSLNDDETVYMFDLKVSNGGHEGSTNQAMWRSSKTVVPHLSGEWACGAGHVLVNRITCKARCFWLQLYTQHLPADANASCPQPSTI